VHVYGDNATKKTEVYNCVTRFSEGRESVSGKERSGQPAMSRTKENIAKVRQIMRENRRMTVRSIAEQTNSTEKQLGKC
jgi:ABC-type branched-subunit amino acid transport system ATPase component